MLYRFWLTSSSTACRSASVTLSCMKTTSGREERNSLMWFSLYAAVAVTWETTSNAKATGRFKFVFCLFVFIISHVGLV